MQELDSGVMKEGRGLARSISLSPPLHTHTCMKTNEWKSRYQA